LRVSALLVFTARREFERKLNMSWHHSDLYLFLCLLTGFATFLMIVYECIRKFRRRKPVYLKKAKPLDGLQRDRPAQPTEERASKRPSDFSRLCESVKDLPPKEQARRMRDYFGILGGARHRFRRRLTPGEAQRLEQRSHTRLYSRLGGVAAARRSRRPRRALAVARH
jgi:hypothetical protein